jgi:small GTP-binding protein
MTLVVGTAGHIDHGKTSLLRALTGIDADRLPEERRRGMTIDVGYAHLTLPDGKMIDFVDVPGHDRLVGNMLVGAGEIDVALLVVAVDDGPRAQTLEHLALLDALQVPLGVTVVTKVDAVHRARVDEVVADVGNLLASTSLADSAVLTASAVTGEGLDDIRLALERLRTDHEPPARPPTLAIDRVFSVKGRGVVVTGTLRGGPLTAATRLRLMPGHREVRIREIQVHGSPVDRVDAGGRTALNLGGVEVADLERGMVLTADPEVLATDRLLVAFRGAATDRMRGRVHVNTAATDGVVGRTGRDALVLDDGRAAGIVRLTEPVALRPGDRLVLRRGPSAALLGGTVLDIEPPRGISRRRQTGDRVSALAAAAPDARLDLHGSLDGRLALDVAALAAAAAVDAVGDATPLARVRTAVAQALRRVVTIRRDDALDVAARVVDDVIAAGGLIRDGDVLRRPGTAAARAGSGAHRRDGPARGGARYDVPTTALGRCARGPLSCGRDSRARKGDPHRGPRARPGVRDVDLQGAGSSRARDGEHPTAYPGGVSRRHRFESKVRDGDPRGPRPSSDPPPDPRRPRTRATGADGRRSMTERVTALILAGGRSSRFGRDKLAEPIDGRTMLDHVVDRVRDVATDVVVVAAAGASIDLPSDVEVVQDDRSVRRPAGRSRRRSPSRRPRRRTGHRGRR